MPLVADPFTVRLVPHRAWDDKATIPDWIDHPQYLVYVHSVGLKHRNDDCKLQVGIIGKQAGANFSPTNEFNYFTYPQQLEIARLAKLEHGSASAEPHNNLAPHEDIVPDEDFTGEVEEES